MKRLFALFVASVVASACGSGGPLAPTAPGSSAAGVFTVSGSVAAAASGRPLAAARVELSSGIESRLAHTDSGGFYAVQGLTSGPWSVTVGKLGYESQSINVDVTGDMTLSFELSRRRPEFP